MTTDRPDNPEVTLYQLEWSQRPRLDLVQRQAFLREVIGSMTIELEVIVGEIWRQEDESFY